MVKQMCIPTSIHSFTEALTGATLYIVQGTGSSEVRQKPVLKELAVQWGDQQ